MRWSSDLRHRQLELIARLAALEPTPSFMGGYAEDALLAGSVTRPHEDVDLITRGGLAPGLPVREAELGERALVSRRATRSARCRTATWRAWPS
jgi:hypothetical protein